MYELGGESLDDHNVSQRQRPSLAWGQISGGKCGQARIGTHTERAPNLQDLSESALIRVKRSVARSATRRKARKILTSETSRTRTRR